MDLFIKGQVYWDGRDLKFDHGHNLTMVTI